MLISSITADKATLVVMLVYASILTPKFGSADVLICNTNAPYVADAPYLSVPSLPDAAYVTDARAAKWVRFQILLGQWHSERGVRSSIPALSMLPSYQKIIGMGEDAVPLIIAQLRSEGDDPDHWFWALAAITEANPVDPRDRGDSLKMANSWIKWAEDMGYAG